MSFCQTPTEGDSHGSDGNQVEERSGETGGRVAGAKKEKTREQEAYGETKGNGGECIGHH